MTDAEFNTELQEFARTGKFKQAPRQVGIPESTDVAEVHRGKTPNGGDYSVAYFYDADGNPCKRDAAKRINFVEYTKDGIRVNECYTEV